MVKVNGSCLQHLFNKNYKLNRGTKVPSRHKWVKLLDTARDQVECTNELAVYFFGL